jgi:predicted DNA-binding transcriptional regulator AlpA
MAPRWELSMSEDRCLSMKEVLAIVPYSRTHITRRETDPKYMGADPFPKRVRLGEGKRCRVCYWLSEVMAWMARRPR